MSSEQQQTNKMQFLFDFLDIASLKYISRAHLRAFIETMNEACENIECSPERNNIQSFTKELEQMAAKQKQTYNLDEFIKNVPIANDITRYIFSLILEDSIAHKGLITTLKEHIKYGDHPSSNQLRLDAINRFTDIEKPDYQSIHELAVSLIKTIKTKQSTAVVYGIPVKMK